MIRRQLIFFLILLPLPLNLSMGAEETPSKQLTLLVFTGSDWCHWCQKLEAEIFESQLWKTSGKALSDRRIHDFPQRKKLSVRQSRKNKIAAEKWKVKSFPSVIVIETASSKELWRHGYLALAPEQYIEQLSKLRAQLSPVKPQPEFTKPDKQDTPCSQQTPPSDQNLPID